MSNRDEQKGDGATNQPRRHVAEGQHGDKTHARLIEQLHSGAGGEPADDQRAARHEESAHEGKRRLVEDRQQHDEAERNSEKDRLARSSDA